MENTPYYSNNLDILKCYVKDESVDFVYLDHPFNSNVNDNVLKLSASRAPHVHVMLMKGK